ncbi:SDR family oxidoreductase [uncultured Desulfovibrio sp.]|uniref:SDR family NAD(P)-dependent oxidoreductase n=1 Tax=uncultured Desulfovibrio sp. TaxID=167968 RepID=UPI0026036183|nr:SDR family oxidoreductase [uncultured Desulfovibrio sp.]
MSSSTNAPDYPGVAGKCYLVTGASSGIGRECAILLSQLRASVILNGRREERLQETRDLMEGDGHLIAGADLQTVDLNAWLNEQTDKAGVPLAGIAHCAGSHAFAPLRGFSPAKMQQVLQEHVITTSALFQAVVRSKKREKECSLTVMTSISARSAVPGNALYGAARACMDSMCRSFAVEYAPFGIRCNAVSGGFMTGSGMTGGGGRMLGANVLEQMASAYPLGLGHVRDAANALVFLLGSASRWISGTILTVDGGLCAKGV